MRTFLLSLSLIAAPALAACGGDDGHDHDHDVVDANPGAPDGGPPDAEVAAAVETMTFTLAPGVFAEGSFTAGAGDRVVIELGAATPIIAWNVHGHVGGGTQTIIEGDNEQTVTYEFSPTETGDWFVMLGNSGADTADFTATLSFYGDASFGQWL
ncbi:MAG: hypothetical protein H6708_10305 [Kofleriaceae bacterium]|nr:hypothetical protein [Kofleriaceae bacterium]